VNHISANVYLTRLLSHTPLRDSSLLPLPQIPPNVIPLPDFWERHREESGRRVWERRLPEDYGRGT